MSFFVICVLVVEALVGQLRTLHAELQRVEQRLHDLFTSHPDYHLFKSFPGAGPVLGPRLLAAWGADRNRFQGAEEMQEFSGVAPVTERSGKKSGVHWRLACPKFLRQSFHEFAAQSRLKSPWADAYYHQMRERGLWHHAALRALAFKWIRIMYRCWKDHVPYDERRYQEALERRARLWPESCASSQSSRHARERKKVLDTQPQMSLGLKACIPCGAPVCSKRCGTCSAPRESFRHPAVEPSLASYSRSVGSVGTGPDPPRLLRLRAPITATCKLRGSVWHPAPRRGRGSEWDH